MACSTSNHLFRATNKLLLFALLLVNIATLAMAKDTPPNLRKFYNMIRNKDSCDNVLASGFHSRFNGPNNRVYCGDYLDSLGIIYVQGSNGTLVNMDVDCDRVRGSWADDSRCQYALSPDAQNKTSFCNVLADYGRDVTDLNPYVHPYIVFGNSFSAKNITGWRTFDPARYGMQPLSVMAVICNGGDTVVYGVWGDTNGDDSGKPMVGEASLALASMCGGSGITGANGIDEEDVLYIGFVGDEAVPGPDGAEWDAKDSDTFEKSIEPIGDKLVQKVQASSASTSAGSNSPRGSPFNVHCLSTLDWIRLLALVVGFAAGGFLF